MSSLVTFPLDYSVAERARFFDDLASWLWSAPLRELFADLGLALPPNASDRDPRERIRALDAIAPWREPDPPAPSVSGRLADAVMQAAEQLGLRSHRPPAPGRHAVCFVVGGTRLAPLLRTRWLAEHLGDGTTETDHVVFLGSERPIAAWERSSTDTYAPGARTELELMRRSCELELGDRPSVRGRHIVDVSSRRSGLQPRAVEAVGFEVQRLSLRKGDSVVLVTSALYAPQLHLDVVREVGARCSVHTASFPVTWNRGSAPGIQSAPACLSALHATISAALRLVDEAG